MNDSMLRSKQEKDGRVYRYRLPLSASVLSHTTTAETLKSTVSNSNSFSQPPSTTPTPTSASATSFTTVTSATTSFITPTILPIIDSAGLEYTGEMARIDDTLKGSQYRYSYSMTGFSGASDGVNICDNLDTKNARDGFTKWALVKRDHIVAEHIAMNKTAGKGNVSSITAAISNAPSALIWSEDNCYPSEPIFVCNRTPSSLSTHSSSNINTKDLTREDDGVLLSEVYDAVKQESFLLILCAKTMKESTRCYIGQIRPASFHGQFIPVVAAACTGGSSAGA